MTCPRPILVILVALTFAALPLGSGPAAADQGKIQPGDIAYVSAGQCTLNFVFDGPGGKTYIGIAAHCVGGVGDTVATSIFGTFGEVAWMGYAPNEATDFAFIRVYDGFADKVDPAVRGHPSYPTGFTRYAETSVGDLIQASGHGAGYGLTYDTQTKRNGFHVRDNAATYGMNGPIIFGDSGGPLVHIETGKAYGIVSKLCVGIGCDTQIGPTVQGMVDKAAAAGFPVTLRTV